MALSFLIQRINILKLSGYYSGTLCEFNLADDEKYLLMLESYKT